MSYLYAVKMLIPDYRFEPIKIGFSVEPSRRVKEFTRGPFPVVWLGQWRAPNGRLDETEAHQRFAAYRLGGEWFYPAPELLAFIETLITGQGRVLTSEKKIAKFEERYSNLFPVPSPPDQEVIPDPFDVSDLVRPSRLAAIEFIKNKWPRVALGPQFLKRSDVAQMTGLSEEMVEQYIDLRFQLMNTIRYGLRGMMDFLDRYPEYAERIAEHMKQTEAKAA